MDRRPTELLAPVATSTPPGNSFARIVLPESRSRGSETRSASDGRVLDQRRDALPREPFRQLDGRLHQHRRAGRVVDDVAQHVQQHFAAADLRRLHEHHARERRGRAEAVHDLAQEGRPRRAPPARLAGRDARQHAVLVAHWLMVSSGSGRIAAVSTLRIPTIKTEAFIRFRRSQRAPEIRSIVPQSTGGWPCQFNGVSEAPPDAGQQDPQDPQDPQADQQAGVWSDPVPLPPVCSSFRKSPAIRLCGAAVNPGSYPALPPVLYSCHKLPGCRKLLEARHLAAPEVRRPVRIEL